MRRLRAIWEVSLYFLRRRDWRGMLQALRAARCGFPITYRRYVYLARPLDQPLPGSSQPQLEVTVRRATLDDIEQLQSTSILPWRLQRFANRVHRGDLCFVAVLPDGGIVSLGWASTDLSTPQSHAISLEAGDIYIGYTYTLPGYRRLGIQAANFAAGCRFLRGQGYKRLLAQVEARNIATLALARKFGFQKIGQFTLLKFLDRVTHSYTPASQPDDWRSFR